MIANKEDIEHAVNKKEIYRYLGYGSEEPDASIRALVEQVLLAILHAMEPKCIYQLYPCKTDGGSVFLGNMEFQSRNLAGNLAQCGVAALMAATLGIETDKLLQKYEVLNMAKASIAQACGAACIETYCNLVQEKIRLDAQERNGQTLFIRPRFSPGYGDLPIEAQKKIFAALDCTKRIGLTLTQSLLMVPTKSVTAFIGFTSNPENCHIEKCKICAKEDCQYRI